MTSTGITSGLLITLSSIQSMADVAVQVLPQMQGVTTGERRNQWMAAVIEADSPEALEELHNLVSSTPGIEHVDVVSVHFDKPSDPESVDAVALPDLTGIGLDQPAVRTIP